MTRHCPIGDVCAASRRRANLKSFAWAMLALNLLAGRLAAQPNQPPRELIGHSASVSSVVYTPNQKFIATAGADQTVRIWYTVSGKEVRKLAGHTAQVLSVASSPDSSVIISGAADNAIRMWDVPRPHPLRIFSGHTAPVQSEAVSPDGKWAVTFGDDKTGRIWNLGVGSVSLLLEEHAATPLVAAVRGDNLQIAGGDATGNISAWGSIDGKSQGKIGAHTGPIRGLAFHPNNQQLVSAGDDGTLKLWQLPLVAPRTLAGHSLAVRAVAVTSDGQLAVTGDGNGVRVFNVGSGQNVRELTGATGATAAIAIGPSNAIVAAAGEAGAIKFWNLADGVDRLQILGHDRPIRAITLHPDNARIASAGEDGSIRIWRLPTAPIPLAGHAGDVLDVAISPNGQTAATVSADKSVRLWNPINGQAITQLNGHEQPLTRVAYRADSAQLASGDAAGQIRFWNAADGVAQGVIEGHSAAIRAMAFHPTGETLATVGADGCLKMWKLPVSPPKVLAGNAEAVNAVAMSSDSKSIVTGGADKSVRVYDTTTGEQTRALAEVPDAVTSLALGQDDAVIAAGLKNGSIKFWLTADGALWKGIPAVPADPLAPVAAAELLGHDGSVVDLAFVRQSGQVVSAGTDGTIRLWRLPAAPRVIRDGAGPASAFVVSPDGKLCASAGMFEERPAILVRDLASGKVIHALLGHEAAIATLAFLDNGTKLASGGADQTTRVWDLGDSKFSELQKVVHASPVTAVAIGGDGTQFVSAAADNVIRCWSVADGSEIQKFTGHTGAVSVLSVVGESLYSGSADGTVRVWNLQTGAAVRTINHGSAVAAVAVSGDGQTIASAGADKLIKFWNETDGAAVASLGGHAAAVVDLRFNADGSRLASVAGDGTSLWDVAGKRRLESFAPNPIASNPVEMRGVGFSGTTIAVGVADGSVQVIEPQLVQSIEAHEGGVNCIALTPEGSRVVSSGADKTVRLWNVADGKLLATFAGPTDVVTSVVVTNDGKLIAGGVDSTMRVWSLPEVPAQQPVAVEQQWETSTPIRSIAVAAGGTRVAIGGDDFTVRIWDVALGRELERFSGHTAALSQVVISTDGTTVASGSEDKTARFANLVLTHVAVVEKDPTDVAFMPDGLQIVTANGDAKLTLWKIGDRILEAVGELPATGTIPAGFVAAPQRSLTVRADGSRIASLDDNGRVHVWNTTDNSLQQVIQPPPTLESAAQPVAAPADAPAITGGLEYTADGARLLVANGQTLRVFESNSGQLLQRFDEPTPVTAAAIGPDNLTLLVGHLGAQDNAALRHVLLERLIDAHEGPVNSLAFLPNGNGLVSGGDDKLVRLWNVADGVLQRTYTGADGAVNSIAITKDALRIVAGGTDNSVRIWPINPSADENGGDAAAAATMAPEQSLALVAPIRGISLSPDNLKLAACGDDGRVYVFEIPSGRLVERFAANQSPALAVAFAPDNKTLVAAGSEAWASVLTMAHLRTVVASESPLHDVALANAGAQAVTASKEGVQQWNLSDGSLVRAFAMPAKNVGEQEGEAVAGDQAEFFAVAVRNDNAQLAAADGERNLVLWNLANGELMATAVTPAVVRRLRYSPDSQKMVALSADDQLRFYSPTDGALTYELHSDQPLESVAFTTDSRTVLTGGEQLVQWLYASPTAIRTLAGHGGAVNGLAYSGDGRWIASASADQTVRIWDAATGVQSKQLTGHVGAAYSVAFSPDVSLLVSCGAEPGLRLWDTLGGRQLKQIPVGDDGLYSVAFFADGKRVAAAGLDRKIYILDVLTGQLQKTLEEHTDYIYRIAFNHSGTRLLSCGYSGQIMVWNSADGQPLFSTQLGRVANSADFSPDGERIVVASGDGKAYFLDVPASAR